MKMRLSNKKTQRNEPIKEMFGKKKKDPIVEVSKKIQNNIKRANLMKEEEIRAYAKNLSDPKSLKKAYLNKDFDAIKQMFNSLPTDSNSKMESFFTSKSDNLEKKEENVKEDEDEDFKFTSDTFDKLSDKHDKIGDKVKVKLVIAEIAKTQSEVTARKLLSPLLSTFSVGGSVGFFHSALISFFNFFLTKLSSWTLVLGVEFKFFVHPKKMLL
jgi:hypothetical protein